MNSKEIFGNDSQGIQLRVSVIRYFMLLLAQPVLCCVFLRSFVSLAIGLVWRVCLLSEHHPFMYSI